MSRDTAPRRRSGLSNFEKRILARGRLVTLDSAALSDREIARELRLSQPSISAHRWFLRSVIPVVGLGQHRLGPATHTLAELVHRVNRIHSISPE